MRSGSGVEEDIPGGGRNDALCAGRHFLVPVPFVLLDSVSMIHLTTHARF